MATVSQSVALRISQHTGLATQFILSDDFSDAAANRVIMDISYGESARLEAAIAEHPVDWWTTMNRLWALEPQTARDIRAGLVSDTVQTVKDIGSGIVRTAKRAGWLTVAVGAGIVYWWLR